MAEYIGKQALLKKMYASHSVPLLISQMTDEDIMFKTMVSIVEEQPTADVVEVKHGEWKQEDDDIFCSECGKRWNVLDNCTETFDYCPKCGAKMDGERKCE